jgi:enediyne polyketide synthase
VSAEEALKEVGPKVLGAINLCNALRSETIKMIVGFSSIIGITGMPGNAWYGFSNEALDNILRRFGSERSITNVISLAFSVWGEVGMGARMGSVENLAKMGIGAIPTIEGVKRFIDLTLKDHGEKQVIVAARLGDLDTWKREHYSYPRASRFLENIQYCEPGVEVIVRAGLSPEKDTYVRDHEWRGTYLFPTVFGLEAMAQAVAYVTGHSDFESFVIEDIMLERPVTVVKDGGCTIEIRALVMERQPEMAETKVRVGIACDQTGFMTDHFAATFVLGREPGQEKAKIELPETSLDIDPRHDLYGNLLFQGPLFQRISNIYSLDSKTCTFKTELNPPIYASGEFESQKDSGVWLLGDPFVRDSLLHAAQLSLSPDICLPVRIGKMERHRVRDDSAISATGKVTIEERKENEYRTSVLIVNEGGAVVEHLKGYILRVMNHDDRYPLPEELVDPGQRDEKIVHNELTAHTARMGFTPPAFSISYVSGFHTLSKTDRHGRELPILRQTVQEALEESSDPGENVRIIWLESGKPTIEGDVGKELGISLSHDGDTIMCVAGQGAQGCDIEVIQQRTQDTWSALLGKEREAVLQVLVENGDSVDEAGTRTWVARETLFKANGSQEMSIEIEEKDGDGVLFRTTDAEQTHLILTFPVKLTRGPIRMIAVTVRREVKEHKQPSDIDMGQHAERLHFDFESYKADIVNGNHDQPVFVFQYPVTFKEASNLSRTLYYSHYFAWIGKLRELVIHPIYDQLVKWFKTGKWGMVTNHAETNIYGEARSGDIIEGRVWVDKISGTEKSTIEVSYEWWKKLSDGKREKIAVSTMSTTWVAIVSHGSVKVSPLPEFCKEFFTQLLPSSSSLRSTEHEITDNLPNVNLGDDLHSEPAGPARSSALLAERTFETTLEDANLVGNIYFSNYYVWQGRTRDHFLKQTQPDYFNGTKKPGEFRCIRCKINHMSEAMPFDRIAVRMYRDVVFERGVRLYFDFYRLSSNGKRHKLGFGEHEAVWHAPNGNGKWIPSELPDSVRSALMSI